MNENGKLDSGRTEELRRKFRESPLYARSFSPFKDFQLMQFSGEDGKPLQGEISRMENIDGKNVPVIYGFKDGYISSSVENGVLLPAIQTANGHSEYWKDGLIVSIRTQGGWVTEEWQDGVPVNISLLVEEPAEDD